MTKWVAVIGYEGTYEISDDGRIRRLPGHYSPHGRLLRPFTRNGYTAVNLSLNNVIRTFYVHRLMADAFGVPGIGPFVRHLDDNRSNNTLGNLMRGMPIDNTADAIANGKFVPKGYPVRAHCKNGHEFTPENTFTREAGEGRGCRACRRERAARYRARGRAA